MIISHKSPHKNTRVNVVRDQQIADGFAWNESVFQIDADSQRLIAGRALKLVKRQLLGEPIEPFQWRTADDQFYTFTVEEFLDFADAVDAHIETIMVESWAAKDQPA